MPAVLETDYLQRAAQRGVDYRLHPAKRVVVTGFANMTPFGNTQENWDGFLTEASPIKQLEVEEHLTTKIGALFPEGYDVMASLHPEDEKQGLSIDAALAIDLTRQSLIEAGLMKKGARYIDDGVINPREMTTTVSSGIAGADQLIEVHKNTVSGRGSRMRADLALQIFPEEIAGRLAMAVGFMGRRNVSSFEACATSLSSVVLGYDILKQGYARAVVVGGMDTLMERHPDETIAVFSSIKALSTRNDDPEHASRPFDESRDGFVLASGGGIAILEDEEFARARGANILAEVMGASKSQDGNAMSFDAKKALTTEMDPVNVADTIIEAMLSEDKSKIYKPDVLALHATATKGDIFEALALYLAFGDALKDMLTTAIKSRIGHMLGGAGIVNFNMGLQMILNNRVPSIFNLENPDPEITQLLQLVRGNFIDRVVNSVLALAYGFGRHNAAVHLARYVP